MRKYSIITTLLLTLMMSSTAYALKPVARTDVVPYQRIKHGSEFKFGVVAFSKPGIDRVEFEISGQNYTGGTKISDTMALNTRVASAKYDGVWEYFVSISASEFSGDGPISVTPTVFDKEDNRRQLDAVTLIVEGETPGYGRHRAWVDAAASDGAGSVDDETDPFPSIKSAVMAAQQANGGSSSGNIIYLAEGTYSLMGVSAKTTGEWLTLTKMPSASRNKVIINQGKPSVNHLKVDEVTIQSQGKNKRVLPDNGSQIWTNGCRIIGAGRDVYNSNPIKINLQKETSSGAYYSTNDYTFDVHNAYGCVTLIRGAVVEKVRNDVFGNYQFVVNAHVTDVDNLGFKEFQHSDILQVWDNVGKGTIPVENRLAYNVYATDAHYQGIMRSSMEAKAKNNAYVNIFIEMREPGNDGTPKDSSFVSEIKSALSGIDEDHLLVWHCSFPYAHASWGAKSTNSSFVGNLFWQLRNSKPKKGASWPANTEWLNNHYMYAYGVTGPCTPTSSDDDKNRPCPAPTSHINDTGAVTATWGDGVVNLSIGAEDFGYPLAGSALIDALPKTYVPVDALGNRRDSRPDVGALEHGDNSGPTEPTEPTEPQVHLTGILHGVDHNWQQVEFTESFVNPVVIAGPPSSNEGDPAVVRLRNITPTGFEIRLQEWDYLDDVHVPEAVSYLVMEQGRHILADGTQVEAGSFNAAGRATTSVTFGASFSTEPVVVTSLASVNDAKAATIRIHSVSPTEFVSSIKEEEASSGDHGEETIGYIAWEPGPTTIKGTQVIAAKTAQAITHAWKTLDFGEALGKTPFFIAGMLPQVGSNTSGLRYTTMSDSSVKVKVEEEQSRDDEISHCRETIGYLLFAPVSAEE